MYYYIFILYLRVSLPGFQMIQLIQIWPAIQRKIWKGWNIFPSLCMKQNSIATADSFAVRIIMWWLLLCFQVLCEVSHCFSVYKRQVCPHMCGICPRTTTTTPTTTTPGPCRVVPPCIRPDDPLCNQTYCGSILASLYCPKLCGLCVGELLI